MASLGRYKPAAIWESASGLSGVPGDTVTMTDSDTTNNAEIRGAMNEKASITNTASDEGKEYPTGFRMAIIVIALVCGVFMLALDLVSQYLLFRGT